MKRAAIRPRQWSDMGLSIPSSWEAVTPDWMTAALADAFPGAEVQEVGVELRDDGTNRRARLALS